MFFIILSIVDDTVHHYYCLAGQLQGILGMQTERYYACFVLEIFLLDLHTYPFCAPCAYFGYMWALPKMYRKTWSERVEEEAHCQRVQKSNEYRINVGISSIV